MEGVFQTVHRHLPPRRDTGDHFQPIVQLQKAVEKLVHRPDVGLIAGKGRIERGDVSRFVVPEDGFPSRFVTPAFAPGHYDQGNSKAGGKKESVSQHTKQK
jgi:hypothetical protein